MLCPKRLMQMVLNLSKDYRYPWQYHLRVTALVVCKITGYESELELIWVQIQENIQHQANILKVSYNIRYGIQSLHEKMCTAISS